MIDHRQVHRFPDKSEALGQGAVGRAWGRIAAGVVVGKDHARAAKRRGFADDIAHEQGRRAFLTVVATEMDAMCIAVDVRHPQMLARRVAFGKAAGKEALGGGETVQS